MATVPSSSMTVYPRASAPSATSHGVHGGDDRHAQGDARRPPPQRPRQGDRQQRPGDPRRQAEHGPPRVLAGVDRRPPAGRRRVHQLGQDRVQDVVVRHVRAGPRGQHGRPRPQHERRQRRHLVVPQAVVQPRGPHGRGQHDHGQRAPEFTADGRTAGRRGGRHRGWRSYRRTPGKAHGTAVGPPAGRPHSRRAEPSGSAAGSPVGGHGRRRRAEPAAEPLGSVRSEENAVALGPPADPRQCRGLPVSAAYNAR